VFDSSSPDTEIIERLRSLDAADLPLVLAFINLLKIRRSKVAVFIANAVLETLAFFVGK
jgi:hypothetical protein